MTAVIEPRTDTTFVSDQATAGDLRVVERIRDYLPELIRVHSIPGLNVAVARRGEVIYEEGFGWADIARQVPMTRHTVMHSGSMGKTYLATAVMQLVERGVVGLHEPINKHLRHFQLVNPLGEREITVYDLLTHRSGLTPNNATSSYSTPVPLADHLKDTFSRGVHDLYHGSVASQWLGKVGQAFMYSNYGMATLGYLVEVANPDGLSFSDYVQRNIIDPLGMSSTQYPPVQDAAHVRPDIFERLSTGYAGYGEWNIPTPTVYFADYPAGTVVTTPGDHIRLLLAYLGEGTYNGNQLLRPETVRAMLTPQTEWPSHGRPGAVGLVWRILNHGAADESFGHGGGHMFGFTNDYRAYPRLDLAVAVATNRWDQVWWSMTAAPPSAVAMAEDAIASWVAAENQAPRPRRSWAWKESYAIGMLMAERLQGSLSITEPLTADHVETMLASQFSAIRPGARGDWEVDAFRAGVADILAGETTAPALREFMASERLQVDQADLEVIYRSWGAPASVPVPIAWA